MFDALRHLTLKPPAREATGFLLATFALLPYPAAHAQNFGRGQELFEHQCQACHDDMHEPSRRKAKSLDELKKRVEAWSTHTGAHWTKSEVGDVLYFLNKSFYKFPHKAL
jgi:mono/diheme cytochrome c family protein